MAKYDSLRTYLAGIDDVVCTVKLDEIENIIGSKLPKSARAHRTWWANSGGSLVHQNAWLDAGWRVERADLSRDVVIFRRMRIGGTGAMKSVPGYGIPTNGARTGNGAHARQMAAMREPITITLRAQWTRIGELDELTAGQDLNDDEAGVIRMVYFQEENPTSVLIDCKAVKAAIGALTGAGKAELANGPLAKLVQVPANVQAEVDMIRPGNAWLLTGGRGRKADLDQVEERRLVAQLLLLQEMQSGRGQKLVSL